MLTSDLVLATVRKGEVLPRYVEPSRPETVELARSLIQIFAAAVGRQRGELEAELADFLGTGTAFLLHRGLAKLLEDRCTFETRARHEPAELRQEVFAAAARAYREGSVGEGVEATLGPLVEELGRRFGLDREELSRSLYSDLKGQQILAAFDPIRAESLLDRYNSALAQGVLLRAQDLTIEITRQPRPKYRALLRKVKFHQLLHRIEPITGGYRLHLDGPLSLFSASSKYGVQMASFLPTLLHFDGWELTARLLWGPRRQPRLYKLAATAGLRPHTRLTAQWLPEELGFLPQQWPKLGTPWQLEEEAELLPLGGQGVMVPDYVFRHETTGQEVYVEVFGFWNRAALASRLELVRRHGPKRVILAVSRALAAETETSADLPAEVYVFRSSPIARELLARLQRFDER